MAVASGTDNLVLTLHASEAAANSGSSAKYINSTGQALIDNKSNVTGDSASAVPRFYTFERYWVRVETNDVAKEVQIDWGEAGFIGRNPAETSVTIIKSETPTTSFVTSHIFTRGGVIRPMVRCKGLNGMLSKWYVNAEKNDGSLGSDTDGNSNNLLIHAQTESHPSDAYQQNSFSEVTYLVDTPRMPLLLPANHPPTAITKVDKKRVLSGIDNTWLGQHETARLRDYNDEAMTISGTALTTNPTILAQVSRHMNGSTERRTGVQVRVTYKDAVTKQVRRKTLTCDGGGTNNKIEYCYQVLKIELVNVKENSDTYMNSTGASDTTLARGERVWIYTPLTGVSGSRGLTTDASCDFANIDNVIGFVSTGNPIMSLDDPHTTVNVDLSESKCREANISIDEYYIDDNKLVSNYSQNRTQKRNALTTQLITDVLANGDAENYGSTAVANFNYSLSRNKNILDSDYRFFSEKRLIRGQVSSDMNATWKTYGSYQNKSPIITFRTHNTGSSSLGATDYNKDNRVPSSLEDWTYGALLMTTQPNAGSSSAPNWVAMEGYNLKASWPLMTSAASPNVYLGDADTTSGEPEITVDDVDGLRVGQNITDGGGDNGTISSIDSYTQITASGNSAATASNTTLVLDGDNGLTATGGTDIEEDLMDNWLLIAHRHKFDRLFWRTTHKRDAYDDVTGNTSASVTEPLNVGTNYPKFNVQLFYPAKTGAASDEITFKPLAYFDGTKDPDTDWSTFIRSGEFIWNNPLDWIKTKHSANVKYPINNANFSSDTAGGHGPADRWNQDSWCILVGISMEDSSVSSTGKSYVNIDSVLPYNNTHSTLVEISDPMHISLNDRSIASSVSYARKGRWQEVSNRLGKSQLRQIGAESGQIKIGGVDLASSTDREKFYKYQRKGTPVYYDVEHKGDNTTTRMFGHIIDMAEDTPTGGVHPKFSCSLKITKTLEYNTTTGAITSNGYISLGGDLGGNYNYVPTS